MINKRIIYHIAFSFLIFYILFANNITHLQGDEDKIIEGSLEMNNVKLNGVENAVKHLGTAAVYGSGITAGVGLLKNTTLPLGAKVAGTIGMGVASLAAYSYTQKVLSLNEKHGNISVQADTVKTSVNASNSGTKPFSNASALEDSESVSLADIVEILNLQLIMQYIIIYLFILTFIFSIFR